MKKFDSLYSIARPDFLSGVAGIFDSAGALLEYDFSEESDTYAIAADWAVVGSDLWKAIDCFEGATVCKSKVESKSPQLVR